MTAHPVRETTGTLFKSGRHTIFHDDDDDNVYFVVTSSASRRQQFVSGRNNSIIKMMGKVSLQKNIS